MALASKRRDDAMGMIEPGRIRDALTALKVPNAPGALNGWRGSQTASGVVEPAAVLRPRNGEEVTAVLTWARQHRIPLSTFSSGAGPHERGMTAAEPTALLDLSAMQQVFNVDVRDAMAIIEPGVTYAALDARLAAAGLRAIRPLAPRRNKSVIASLLEREPTLQSNMHWDVLDPFGSAEIVFGNGERFRTGSAALAGTMTEHLEAGLRYLTAYGPATTDFLRVLQGAQGTLGIVTWAAVMCERVPTMERSVFIADQTPERLVRLLSWVHWRRLGNAVFLGNALQFASLGEGTADAVARLAERLPPWAVWLRIGHGGSEFPQEQFDCELAELRERAEGLGLQVVDELASFPAGAIDVLQATAAEDVYQDRLAGGHRSVFCLQTLDRIGVTVEAVERLLRRQGWPQERLAAYVQPRLQGRNAHVEFVLPYATGQAAAARRLEADLVDTLLALGGFFSRPYGAWASRVFARHLPLQPYLRQAKSLFDPGRILNPGRLCY